MPLKLHASGWWLMNHCSAFMRSQAQVHVARRCSGAATHQLKWWWLRHRLLRETVAGLRQHDSPTTSRCICVECKRTMVISSTPLLCSCCDSAYQRSCSELTRVAATAALHGGSWICNRCAVVPPSRPNIAAI